MEEEWGLGGYLRAVASIQAGVVKAWDLVEEVQGRVLPELPEFQSSS